MTNRTLIIGNSYCALTAAKDLCNNGIDVILAVRNGGCNLPMPFDSENMGRTSIEVLLKTELVSCTGTVGNFEIILNRNGEKVIRTTTSMIIAEDHVSKSNFSSYDLKPSSGVLSLSEVADRLNNSTDTKKIFAKGGKVVFLSGLYQESHPVIVEKIMQLSLIMQSEFNVQTYILTGNLKVAGNGLEALYQKSKESGAIYLKFTDSRPDIRQKEDGKTCMAYQDEITGHQFTLTPAITIVDETIFASDYLGGLAEILRLDKDREGFLQTENVHRFNVFTNRKGIFVAGPSRAIQSRVDQNIDASCAAIANLQLLNIDNIETKDTAEINTGTCVRCLTCYRICPYRAIVIDINPQVIRQACEGCGICLAECPRHAISIKGFDKAYLPEISSKHMHRNKEGKKAPYIVAFCCSRSANQAMELAHSMGSKLPEGFTSFEMPCAGSVSVEHILAAFQKGADGILILACHEGNCHSQYGNVYAQRRVGLLKNTLKDMGFEQERLAVHTLASNMGKEFETVVTKFEKRMSALGSIMQIEQKS
ncbi:MAG: hydrogenase iron-sulfur subunit [Desulfobacteraceae bacterium]|nr:hydrogenase iron-sulfur subunit [Desulfobacteraceae bacterium]